MSKLQKFENAALKAANEVEGQWGWSSYGGGGGGGGGSYGGGGGGSYGGGGGGGGWNSYSKNSYSNSYSRNNCYCCNYSNNRSYSYSSFWKH